MEITTLLYLFASGCAAGFLAGFFGIGGGVILVPIFLFLFETILGFSDLVATHVSLGTSLLVVLFASLTSAYRHYRNGHVVPVAVAYIGLTSLVAAFTGTYLAAMLSGATLRQLFAVILALTSVGLLAEKSGSAKRSDDVSPPAGGMILTGAGSGLISGMTGVGGGIFAVPMMYYLMRFPLRKAVGTSSAVIALTASAGVVGYILNGLSDPDLAPYAGFTAGYVDYIHAIPVIVGTLPTAKLGAELVRKTDSRLLRLLFGILLLVISVRMFFLS